MRTLRVGRQLPCSYTDDELNERRDRLSEVILQIPQVEMRKSSAAKAFKEEIDGLYSESAKLARQIKERSEDRLVDCIVKLNDPESGSKTLVRLDTGEIVLTEPMTHEERQDMLFEGLEKDFIDHPPPPESPEPPQEPAA